MPSFKHEALVQLFRNRPELAAELLVAVLGLELPVYDAIRIQDANLSQVEPTEYRTDHVVLLEKDEPVMGIIVEVQQGIDPVKRFTWPAYQATLRSRFRCPCCLLVVTTEPKVAKWAQEPIELGQPGSPFSPVVLGPASIPRITDPAQAEAVPELAVLSVRAHGRGEGGMEVAVAALRAASGLEEERAVLYSDLVLLAVSDAVRIALEEDMRMRGYVPQSEILRKPYLQGREEGRVRGIAEALLRMLAARGLEVAEAHRERILTCQDPEQLDRWIDRAARAESVDELLG